MTCVGFMTLTVSSTHVGTYSTAGPQPAALPHGLPQSLAQSPFLPKSLPPNAAAPGAVKPTRPRHTAVSKHILIRRMLMESLTSFRTSSTASAAVATVPFAADNGGRPRSACDNHDPSKRNGKSNGTSEGKKCRSRRAVCGLTLSRWLCGIRDEVRRSLSGFSMGSAVLDRRGLKELQELDPRKCRLSRPHFGSASSNDGQVPVPSHRTESKWPTAALVSHLPIRIDHVSRPGMPL